MLNRKLFEVIPHLTSPEKKQLRQFLASPYFNNGSRADDIVRLYDRILKYGADETHPALSKKTVFQFLFPQKNFVENVKSPLDTLTSDLFGLIRRFLAQLDKEKDTTEVAEHLALARFYRKFSFEERFWKTMGTLRTLQQASPLRDTKHYFWQFQIEEEIQRFQGIHNSFEDDANLYAVHKNLDIYYSTLKLEYTCSLMYQKQTAQVEKIPTDPLMDLVLQLAEDGSQLDVPINRIYRLLIFALQHSVEGGVFESIESLLKQFESQIDAEKFKNLMALMRFLSVREYRKSGDDKALRYTFNIYKDHLGLGYFYIDQQIPLTTYRNLVVFSLKLGEFDWTKKFLESHPPEAICGTRYPAEFHSLNMAEYYFYIKEYDQALKAVVYRLFENPTVSIIVDLLIIKIYYETQNDMLESRMKALDQKIRRSQLSRKTKNRYHNFIKMLDKIIRYGWQNNSPKRAKWTEEIKNTPEIVAREWLLEKLA